MPESTLTRDTTSILILISEKITEVFCQLKTWYGMLEQPYARLHFGV
jgi:hypothetical protein